MDSIKSYCSMICHDELCISSKFIKSNLFDKKRPFASRKQSKGSIEWISEFEEGNFCCINILQHRQSGLHWYAFEFGRVIITFRLLHSVRIIIFWFKEGNKYINYCLQIIIYYRADCHLTSNLYLYNLFEI